MSARADDLARDFATATRTARSGRRGPVHLSLPTDCLEGEVDMVQVPDAEAFAADAMALGAETADAMLALLAAARRPLIVTGPALMTHRGRAAALRLQDAALIPVVGMESPRGLADASLGGFARMLAQADCVLLLGKKLDYALKYARPPAIAAGCALLQIDAEQDELDRARRAAGARLVAQTHAEPLVAAETLAQRAKAAGASAWHDEVLVAIAERPAAWNTASSSQPGRLHPLQALRPLQGVLDQHADSVLIMDGGEFSQWAQACLTGRHRITNGPAGAIGAGPPFAVAARIAEPDAPVIAIMGDGTFGFHPAEIDTAVRYRLPFVCIVGNDARWNAEYQIQLRDYGANRAGGCELLATRYDEVARAFGGHGELVTRADDMLPAVRRAMASGLPAVVNVALDGQAAPSFAPMKTS
jgi:acetolactate synthase-1/2/3 large subunit